MGMTFGQLFTVMNPDVKVRENSTCMWLFFDEVNHYTIAAEWWKREIPDDAVKLLKEQETKVLTREELKQFDERPCWFESHGTYMGEKGFWIIPYMFTCYETMSYVYPLAKRTNRGDYHVSELGLSAYNKAWRCWSSKPTDEQREAVKWDD